MPEQRFTNVLEWRATNPSATVQVNERVGKSVADVVAKENLAITVRERSTESSNRRVTAYANEAEVARKLGLTLEQLGVKADAAQQGDIASVSKQLDVERQITAEMEKQIAANDQAIRGRIGGAGSSGIATGFGGSLRSVGAAVGNLGGGQSVTQAASLIGLAELGPAAVAVGALGLGLKLVTENAKQAAEAVAASAKAFQDVRESALTQTRAELELERDRAQELIQIRQQAADEAQAAFREAERNAAPIALLLNTDAFVEGLEAVRDQSKTALTEVQNELNALNIVLADTSVSAADAAEAERRLTEARTQQAVDEADIRIRLRTTTAEERAERARAIEDEIDILRQQADAAGKGSEAGKIFEARIISLQQELDLTANSAKTYGDALERLREKEEAHTKAIQEQIDIVTSSIDYNTALSGQARNSTVEQVNERLLAFQDEKRAIESLLPRLQELAPTSEKAAQALDEAQIRLVRLSEDGADQISRVLPEALSRSTREIQSKITELVEGRDARLLELQADYQDRRTEVFAEGEDRRVEAAKDAADRMAKIERDFGRSRDEAVGNRSANDLRLARIRAADAAEDAKEGADKQAEAAQKAQAKQLVALDKGYDKQVQSTITAANKQISVQQAALSQQLFLAQQARDNQVFLTAQGMNQVVTTVANGWQLVVNATAQAFNSMISTANSQVGFGTSTFATPTFPTLTNSIQGRALDARIDARIVQIKRAARGGRTLTA